MILHIFLNHILVLLWSEFRLFHHLLQALLRVLTLDIRIDGFALGSQLLVLRLHLLILLDHDVLDSRLIILD